MENLATISVPIIVSVVYALISVITKAVNNSEKFKRFIPLLALIFGAVLGGVAGHLPVGLLPVHGQDRCFYGKAR